MIYRIEVPATIVFDVEAEDESDALFQACNTMEEHEGFDLDALSFGRAYPNTHPIHGIEIEGFEIVDSMPDYKSA